MGVWSFPLVTIRGSKQGLKVDIGRLARTTGWKLSSLGYMSSGERVPEVIITEANRSKTGLIAIEASKQLNCSRGSLIPETTDPSGSKTTENPSKYVARSVAKFATSCNGLNSSRDVISRVRSREFNRE